jgi:hypothetical protein
MPKPLGITNNDQKIATAARNIRRLERRSSGLWHYVGTTGEPPFQNGWSNAGGGLLNLRYRWNLAGGTDIQGSITSGTPGSIIFSLPSGYYDPDGEARIIGVDDAGVVVPLRIVPTAGPTRADVYHVAV